MIAEFFIREATESDASAISEVLLASIRELCARDHGGAEASIQQWLANKTPQNILRWLRNRDNIILVAERDGAIAAVGGLQTSGTVLPHAQVDRLRGPSPLAGGYAGGAFRVAKNRRSASALRWPRWSLTSMIQTVSRATV